MAKCYGGCREQLHFPNLIVDNENIFVQRNWAEMNALNANIEGMLEYKWTFVMFSVQVNFYHVSPYPHLAICKKNSNSLDRKY